jgi:glycosyltransferase involved in cell wall biosynthesis
MHPLGRCDRAGESVAMSAGKTRVFITVDVECAEERIVRGRVQPPMGYDLRMWGRFENLDREVGLPLLMEELEAYGLRATFFVEPLGASYFGMDGLGEVVRAIDRRGHDVQLHLHPVQKLVDWHARGMARPSDDMADYTVEEQEALLREGCARLEQAGARPGSLLAFRAGNFGASNETWEALRRAGMVLSSSYDPGYFDVSCRMRHPDARVGLFPACPGVWELPITCIREPSGKLRHLQITAVSVPEMELALAQYHAMGVREVTLVTHSFEMCHIDSIEGRLGRVNRVNLARLRGLCRFLRDNDDRFQVMTAGELTRVVDSQVACTVTDPPQGSRRLRIRRLAEQGMKRVEARIGASVRAAGATTRRAEETIGDGMRDQNIICFAKDWTEDPTSNNHVMRLLARNNRVLWLNSIAARTPTFSSGRDLGKMARKLRSFTKGYREVLPNLFVYTPIVLPFPHSRAAQHVNRQILKATVGLLRRRLGMRDFQLWTFLPTSVEYVDDLGASLLVYYCTDEFSQFSYLDRERIIEQETRLLRKADIVFATAHSLVESKGRYNPNTHLASHGVDHEHFARALDDTTPVAAELKSLKGPVLGFFGLVQDWIDVDLMAWLAEQRPGWNVVVIGKSMVDLSTLRRLPNVTILDRRPYEALPSYCKAFSVGLIPFRINELTSHVNPIKLREYLSAGLPVVSTDLPEVRHYAHLCDVTATREEFLQACERAIASDTPEARRRRSESMREETWEKKVEALGNRVMETLKARRDR